MRQSDDRQLGHDFTAVLRWLRRLLIGLLGVGLVLLLLWAVVVVPPLVIDTSGIQDPAKRLDEVNSLRTTLAGVLGGLAVAAGAVVAALNFRESSRQNRAMLELQRRGQVTERFTKAIEQLGDEKLDVRIGGVYALEQIARDSAELQWPIMEVLTAYLREHAPFGPADPDEPPPRLPSDHQAIATVLGRRDAGHDAEDQQLDLHGTDLRGADLSHAKLRGADLSRANLRGTNLRMAELYETNLRKADLSMADLRGTDLRRAFLRDANLRSANLRDAKLGMAALHGADLRGADLQVSVITFKWAGIMAVEPADRFDHMGGLTVEQLATAASIEGAQLPGWLWEGGALVSRQDLEAKLRAMAEPAP